MSQRSLTAAAGVAALLTGLVGAGSALAVTRQPAARTAPCSQSGLQAAMNHGGTYDFRRACRLVLTGSLVKRSGSVTFNGDGHAVVLTGASTLTTSAFSVIGGHLTLERLTVTNFRLSPGAGASGAGGTSYADTQTGNDGGSGAAGAGGPSTGGAALSAAAGSVVTLVDDVFSHDAVYGGAGGSGGAGGDGDNPVPADTANALPGGAGGVGAAAGAGGAACGGAIDSAGRLIIRDSVFSADTATGGAGGQGGAGGAGGTGASSSAATYGGSGQGGEGGNAGPGGAGGSAYGGAVYSKGSILITGSRFVGDMASGGVPGNGAPGGAGGNVGPGDTLPATGGPGGQGGEGGDGGNASGGAVYAAGIGDLTGNFYSSNAVITGKPSAACPADGAGCGGAGGAAAPGAAGGPVSQGGYPGADGNVGAGTNTNQATGRSVRRLSAAR